MAGSDYLGILACTLVLCTFATTSMVRLRLVAMASNVAFIGYAWSLGLWPILALHALLLPLNAVRLLQAEVARRRAAGVPRGDVVPVGRSGPGGHGRALPARPPTGFDGGTRTGDPAMKPSTIAAGLVVAALATPASAHWEYTRWGMTAEQVVAASGGKARPVPAARRHRDEAGGYEITVEGTEPGSPRLAFGFQFDLPGGGLRCVIANATGGDADRLRSQLVQRLGPPADGSSFGPTRTLQWTTPDTVELSVNAVPKAAVVNHGAPGRS